MHYERTSITIGPCTLVIQQIAMPTTSYIGWVFNEEGTITFESEFRPTKGKVMNDLMLHILHQDED